MLRGEKRQETLGISAVEGGITSIVNFVALWKINFNLSRGGHGKNSSPPRRRKQKFLCESATRRDIPLPLKVNEEIPLCLRADDRGLTTVFLLKISMKIRSAREEQTLN